MRGKPSGPDARARRDAETVARVFELWRAPGSPWTARLAREHPLYSSRMVEVALPRALREWTSERIASLQADAFAASARPPRHTAVWLAGSIPSAAFADLALPLLLGSAVSAHVASADPVSPEIFVESLRAVDEALAKRVALDAESPLLAEADAVLASGSDETIAALRALVPASTPFAAHGHKLSLAAVGPAAELAPAAARCALDAVLWDGRGCLSPAWIAVIGADRAQTFAGLLADALAAQQDALPLGTLAPVEHMAIRERRAAAALSPDTRVWSSPGRTDWTVILEGTGGERFPGALRTVPVLALGDVGDLVAFAESLAPQLSTLAHTGFPAAGLAELARALDAGGGARLCEAGEMQFPPLDWARDGLAPLRSLMQVPAHPESR